MSNCGRRCATKRGVECCGPCRCRSWEATSAATQRIRGIPQTGALHVVERFTPVDANTIVYRATIEDTNVYTKPWTVEMPLTRDPKYRMFEYSCEEGNYATPNILAGGRKAERDAAGGTKD